MKMPEDSHPEFSNEDERLTYFTLPMSLNYQRDSYKLWEAALQTYTDADTRIVFDIAASATIPEEELRAKLVVHKVALQPHKHIATWRTIAQTIYTHWKTIKGLLAFVDYDYLTLRKIVQETYKKGFPYISGPKIFNYWCFILQAYGGVTLKNVEYIEIAPDTHIIQCSVRLGVISQEESESLSRDAIAMRWRGILQGSGINPIDMHPPLWFWSRNNFKYEL